MVKKIKFDSLEDYIAAIKKFNDKMIDLTNNPPADLNDRAKAWRKMYKQYNLLSDPYYGPCKKAVKKSVIIHYTCMSCKNESCWRYWWEILHNKMYNELCSSEYKSGEDWFLNFAKEINLPLISGYSSIPDEELNKKAVKNRKTGDLYYIILVSTDYSFPNIAYIKVKKDGTKPKYHNYTKLYPPLKVYSGSITADDIKELLTTKFEF